MKIILYLYIILFVCNIFMKTAQKLNLNYFTCIKYNYNFIKYNLFKIICDI